MKLWSWAIPIIRPWFQTLNISLKLPGIIKASTIPARRICKQWQGGQSIWQKAQRVSPRIRQPVKSNPDAPRTFNWRETLASICKQWQGGQSIWQKAQRVSPRIHQPVKSSPNAPRTFQAREKPPAGTSNFPGFFRKIKTMTKNARKNPQKINRERKNKAPKKNRPLPKLVSER